MEPTTILRSDALDILFENRNKQYGAYTLRREYPRRLLIAMAAMAGIVLLGFGFLFPRGDTPKIMISPLIGPDSVTLIILPPSSSARTRTPGTTSSCSSNSTCRNGAICKTGDSTR